MLYNCKNEQASVNGTGSSCCLSRKARYIIQMGRIDIVFLFLSLNINKNSAYYICKITKDRAQNIKSLKEGSIPARNEDLRNSMFGSFFFMFLSQSFTLQFKLILNSLYSPGWPQAHSKLPPSASEVVGLQAYATMPAFMVVSFSPNVLKKLTTPKHQSMQTKSLLYVCIDWCFRLVNFLVTNK